MKTTVRHKPALLFIAVAVCASVLATSAYLLSTPIDISSRPWLIGLSDKARITTTSRLVLRVLPEPRIEGANIGISYMGEEVMRIGRARIVLSPYRLLTLKASVKELDIDGAELLIKKRADKGLNIAGLFKNSGRLSFSSLSSLSIKNSAVSFTDEALSATLPLDTAYISASAGRGKDGLSYSFNAALASGARIEAQGSGPSGGPGLIKGSLSIDNAGLSLLSAYLEPLIPGLKINGAAHIKASYSYTQQGMAEFEGNGELRELTLSHKGLGPRPFSIEKLTMPFSAKFGKGKTLITVKNAAIGMEAVKAGLSLSIDRSAAPGKLIDLSLSTTPISLEKLAGFFPIKSAFKRAGVSLSGGDVSIEDARASFGAADVKNPEAVFKSFKFKAALRRAAFRVKGLDSALSEINGKVSLEDNALLLHDISGNYGKASFESLDGRIYGLDGPAAYELTLKTSLDAKDLLKAADSGTPPNPLLTQGGDWGGLANAIAASGPVELDLNIKGSLRQRSLAAYSGVVGMKRVRLSYAGLTGFLSGRAAFDDNAVLLDSIIVRDGQSNIRIAGSVAGYKTKDPAFDLTVEGTAGGRPLKEVLPDALKDLSIDGQAAFRLALKGRARDYSLSASTDLTAAGISYKGMVKKDSGYPAGARLAAELKQDGIEIQALALTFGGSSVKISGKADMDKPGYALSVASERLLVHDIAHLSPYLEKSAAASGAVHVDIVVSSGNAGKSYKGDISVRDAGFSSAHFKKPFEEVNARAVFTGNSADIKITSLKTGSTELRAGIEVSDIKERLVRFEVDSTGIDLDEALKTDVVHDIFSGKAERPSPLPLPAGERTKVKGAGIVRADRLKLRGLVMKGLSFGVELDEKEARLKDMAFGLNSGSASGGLTFMRSPDDPILFRLGMDFFNVNVQELIKDLGAKGKVMSGELNARVDLTGEKAKNPISSGFNGRISLEARDGSLWKFLTLSKIFSIVNIISISELFEDGYPYMEVTGDFIVKDGIMTTENLMLDAASMRMSGAGEIRLPAREIDGLLGLHPFVTIDKIVTNIPVAGWIIGGKEKSIVSMYYDVKGPLKNPSIEPAPIKSIEKGILGVLERLIEAPVL